MITLKQIIALFNKKVKLGTEERIFTGTLSGVLYNRYIILRHARIQYIHNGKVYDTVTYRSLRVPWNDEDINALEVFE